jgi:hypothetical protein
MNFPSMLFEALEELFKDDQVTQISKTARAAALSASHSHGQISRLAATVEKRIREVERENVILSTLLVRILQHLSSNQPAETQKLVQEVSAIFKSGVPQTSDLLRNLLDIPNPSRTPIINYTKPPTVCAPPSRRPKTPAPRPKKPR